jgi:oligopeptide/dipeptide ABC transporter ATP-binding protein
MSEGKPMSEGTPILRVVDLHKRFPVKSQALFGRARHVRSVDGVTLDIQQGETFGVVGESGSGKTTLARLIMRLVEPTSGQVYFGDREITGLGGRQMKPFRRKMQMIFQDPYGALDPRKTVYGLVAEPLHVHKLVTDREARLQRVRDCLALVELPTADAFLTRVPDELSGGERQRVGIARALVLDPELIVADEPVSMLDASVKAGIADLLVDLKQRIGLTYIFITHELALAHHVCDRIAVMYLGRVVELGTAEEIVRSPLHPYSRLLMDAIPPLHPDPDWGNSIPERGELPFCLEPPSGCRFHPRCPNAQPECQTQEPEWVDVGGGHWVACHCTTAKGSTR